MVPPTQTNSSRMDDEIQNCFSSTFGGGASKKEICSIMS